MDFFQSPDFFTHQIKHLLGSIRHEDSKTWIFPRWNESGSGPSDTNFPSNICIYIYLYVYKYKISLPFLLPGTPNHSWVGTLTSMTFNTAAASSAWKNSWQAKPQPLRLGIGGQKKPPSDEDFSKWTSNFWMKLPAKKWWLHTCTNCLRDDFSQTESTSELHPLKKQAIIASNERSLKHQHVINP